MSPATGITIIPHDGPLAAEVVGVDLSQELDERTFCTIDTASSEHLVIAIRN